MYIIISAEAHTPSQGWWDIPHSILCKHSSAGTSALHPRYLRVIKECSVAVVSCASCLSMSWMSVSVLPFFFFRGFVWRVLGEAAWATGSAVEIDLREGMRLCEAGIEAHERAVLA